MDKKYETGEENIDFDIYCEKCNEKLVLSPVKLEYMGSSFPVELPACPKCGNVYVSEDLATGKIFQVEQSLEDK